MYFFILLNYKLIIFNSFKSLFNFSPFNIQIEPNLVECHPNKDEKCQRDSCFSIWHATLEKKCKPRRQTPTSLTFLPQSNFHFMEKRVRNWDLKKKKNREKEVKGLFETISNFFFYKNKEPIWLIIFWLFLNCCKM